MEMLEWLDYYLGLLLEAKDETDQLPPELVAQITALADALAGFLAERRA